MGQMTLRWACWIGRFICGMIGPLAVLLPLTPLWQLSAGTVYGLIMPLFLGLFGVTEAVEAPYELGFFAPRKRGPQRLLAAIAVWFVIWALWTPVTIFLLNAKLSLLFVLGSFLGVVLHFSLTGRRGGDISAQHGPGRGGTHM